MVGTALGPVDGVSDGSVVRIGNVVATREGNVESIVEGKILAVPVGVCEGSSLATPGVTLGLETDGFTLGEALGCVDGPESGDEDGLVLGPRDAGGVEESLGGGNPFRILGCCVGVGVEEGTGAMATLITIVSLASLGSLFPSVLNEALLPGAVSPMTELR